MLRESGYIKRLVIERGFGFIVSETGDEYFFHHSDLKSGDFRSLTDGDLVTFQPAATPKGARAQDVTLSARI